MKNFDEGYNFERKCPKCDSEFINKEEKEKLTIYHYECEHQVARVLSNEIRLRSTTSEIQKYAKMELDELFTELATTKEPQKMYALTAATIDFPKKGKERFGQFSDELFQRLCVEFDMCSKIKQFDKHDIITTIGLLSSIIVGIENTSIAWYIPSGLLSAIIVKNNIRKFCKCD